MSIIKKDLIDWESMERRVMACPKCKTKYIDMVCKTDIFTICPRCNTTQEFKF